MRRRYLVENQRGNIKCVVFLGNQSQSLVGYYVWSNEGQCTFRWLWLGPIQMCSYLNKSNWWVEANLGGGEGGSKIPQIWGYNRLRIPIVHSWDSFLRCLQVMTRVSKPVRESKRVCEVEVRERRDARGRVLGGGSVARWIGSQVFVLSLVGCGNVEVVQWRTRALLRCIVPPRWWWVRVGLRGDACWG